MSFLPSIRELLQRLEAQASAPATARALRQLVQADPAVLLQPDSYRELGTAALQLDALHLLATQLATYLRHGGTIVQPSAARVLSEPTVSVKPPQAPAPNYAVPDRTVHRAPRAKPPVPVGLLTIEQLMAETRLSRQALYRAMSEGRFPRPTERAGVRKFWLRHKVADDIARMRKAARA